MNIDEETHYRWKFFVWRDPAVDILNEQDIDNDDSETHPNWATFRDWTRGAADILNEQLADDDEAEGNNT